MDQKTRDNLLGLVESNYRTIADDFNTTRRKEIWPEIRKVAEKINNGDRVLDVGCGNGRLLDAFKDKQIEYLGIDSSKELIQLARNNYPNEFLVGNLLELASVPNNNFDYIFCLAVLQHIPSRELRVQALQQMKSKLRQDGEIIISNWNMWAGKHRKLIYKFYFKKLFGNNKMDWGDIMFPWKNSQGEEVSERYYHAFTTRELKSLAQKAKLTIIDSYKDKYNYWLILK